MQQLDEIKSEGVAEMLVNNERRQSLGNVKINTAKNRVSRFYLRVCALAKVCNRRMFASLWSRWIVLLYCRASVSPPSRGQGFDFQTDFRTKPPLFPGCDKTFQAFRGIKKQFQQPGPCVGQADLKKGEVVGQHRITEVSSRDSDKFPWDFHFKQQDGRNVFSHKGCLP